MRSIIGGAGTAVATIVGEKEAEMRRGDESHDTDTEKRQADHEEGGRR